jgi:hypothetical protein
MDFGMMEFKYLRGSNDLFTSPSKILMVRDEDLAMLRIFYVGFGLVEAGKLEIMRKEIQGKVLRGKLRIKYLCTLTHLFAVALYEAPQSL